jgi:hypothetical protein
MFNGRLEGSLKKIAGSGAVSDPLARGMDPRIRVRTIMSRIRNTHC